MKLNIEELAVQAGGSVVGDSDPQCWSGLLSFEKEELEAFARLIVERCAQEAEDTSQEYEAYTGQELALNYSCAAAIRQLLED